MTRVTKFLAASSVIALMAVPAFADTMIGGDAGLGATLHATTGAGANVTAGADAATGTTIKTDGNGVKVTSSGTTEAGVAATVDTNGDGKIDALDEATAMTEMDANAEAHAAIVGHGVWDKDGMMLGKVEVGLDDRRGQTASDRGAG